MKINRKWRRRAVATLLLPRLWVIGCWMFLMMRAGSLYADDSQAKLFAQRAESVFRQARAQYLANTNDPVLAWKFARAAYDWADWATGKTDRAAIAREGMAACHVSLAHQNSAAGHYYLALNMGQLAQAETFSALRLVREMVREFEATAALDKNFDFAGPERGLGLLYRDAPDWPVSLGSRRKAREYLAEAANLGAGDPENILNLAESCLRWNNTDDAKKELETLNELWPKAQKDFAGDDWQQSWADWSKRREALQQRLN